MAYRQPTSTIMICHGYPCDRDHENTLYFASKTAQWTYMRSLIKYTFTAQSYQRYAKNTLRIAARADDLYGCNYLIFSNVALSANSTPADSVPVFYCFIDSVEYINENTTEVRYTIDDMQTFWFNFSMGECYVEREHTESDDKYEHLVPENIPIGPTYTHARSTVDLTKFSITQASDSYTITPVNVSLWSLLFIYVPNDQGKYWSSITSYTGDPTVGASYLSVPNMVATACQQPNPGQVGLNDADVGELRNGVYAAAKYFYVHIPPITPANITKISNMIMAVRGRFIEDTPDAQLLSVTMVPRIFAVAQTSQVSHPLDGAGPTFDLTEQVVRPTTLRGPNNTAYVPRNNRLFSYPFCYAKIDNENGQQKHFCWEFLGGSAAAYADFKITGVVASSPEAAAYPAEYQGETNKFSDNGVMISSFLNSLWSFDSYKSWENNNKMTIAMGVIGQTIGAVASAASGNLSGVGALMGTSASMNDRQSMPDRLIGSQSQSALAHVLGKYVFNFDQVNVYPEAARRIDNFFDMYGYAIEDVKVPNIKDPNVTLRPCWNYVKTAGAVILPASNSEAANSMTVNEIQRIKEMFDRGVRFWSNPAKVGQYSTQDNTPV